MGKDFYVFVHNAFTYKMKITNIRFDNVLKRSSEGQYEFLKESLGKVRVWYTVSFCRDRAGIVEPAKVVLLDDLWWKKVIQWMLWICWDGTKEHAIGTIADLTETWLVSGV